MASHGGAPNKEFVGPMEEPPYREAQDARRSTQRMILGERPRVLAEPAAWRT